MIKLNTSFSEKEKEVLSQFIGKECKEFEILSFVDGESYVFSDDGEYYYNECFEALEVPLSTKLKYDKIVPYRVIRFYSYYLLNCSDDQNIWYRGQRDSNGNWRYDCYSDSLEEAFESI